MDRVVMDRVVMDRVVEVQRGRTVAQERPNLRRRACGIGRERGRPSSPGRGFSTVLTASREQLDLRDQAAVNYWFRANRPDYVFLVAGTVGGILANSTRPAEFIYDNMMIHGTVVHAAHVLRREEVALSRQLVHLPAPSAAADHRGRAADRAARADQ